MNIQYSLLIDKYAQAFLGQFGLHLQMQDQTVMQTLVDIFKNNAPLLFFFKLPASFGAEQHIFLEKLKEKNAMNDTLMKLAELLMKDQRLFLLPTIAKKINALIQEKKQVVIGTIESSHELSEDQKKVFTDFVEKNVHKKVKVTFIINPRLIAGIRIQADYKQWEYSIAQQLTTIERSLTNGD